MSGRGRGRQTSSLTQEQLQALGCVGKDAMPAVPTAPPPTFPQLSSKPVPLEVTPAQNYKVLWKEGFLNYMRDSPYFLIRKETTNNMQRYSDQYINVLENPMDKVKCEIPWHLMPTELKPNSKRKRSSNKSTTKIKKTKVPNIEERLKVLEEREKTGGKDKDKDHVHSDSEKDDNENEEEFEDDDEMDDENDYGNSYFDNGEAFNEEDDNLDDGPIY